jgi:uncharacterized protein
MLDKELLQILACPRCKGELKYEPAEEKLICLHCRLIYLVREDIPVMLIEEAVKF